MKLVYGGLWCCKNEVEFSFGINSEITSQFAIKTGRVFFANEVSCCDGNLLINFFAYYLGKHFKIKEIPSPNSIQGPR